MRARAEVVARCFVASPSAGESCIGPGPAAQSLENTEGNVPFSLVRYWKDGWTFDGHAR